jgi:hypothetical protein
MFGVVAWYYRWLAIAALVAAVAGFGALQMHEHDQKAYNELSAEYVQFKATVAAQGAAAQKKADADKLADKQSKEKADANHAKTVADLNAGITRLRALHDNGPAGSGVPAALPGSGRPDLACFDRAEYQQAYRSLVAEIRGQSDEGTAGTVDLDTAKLWAQTRRQ